MSEFSTEADLSITVEQRELRRVRSEVEDALSDVRLGIGGQGGARGAAAVPDGGAASGRERRRRRREFRWARQRTGDLEDAVVYLEEIEDKVGDDEGGGIFSSLTDLGLDIGGEAGGAAALTGAATALTGAATAHTAAAGAHGGAAAALTGAAAALGSSADERVAVDRPPWIPLPVEKTMLPVDAPGEIAVDTPGALDVKEPTLDVDDPSPLGVDTPTLPVERPTLPVDRTPLPVEVSVSGGGRRSRSQPASEFDRSFIDDVTSTAAAGVTTGAITGATVGATGAGVGAIPGAAIGAVGGGALGAAGGAAGHLGALAHHELTQPGAPFDSSGGQGTVAQPTSEVTNNVTIDGPQASVTVEPQVGALVEEVRSAMEDVVEEQMSEIERDVRQLERELNTLERDIRRSAGPGGV